MLPIAAPLASILAASLPRGAPCSPFFPSFASRVSSMSVALAEKLPEMPGRALQRPHRTAWR